jgi:hypothetical protein
MRDARALAGPQAQIGLVGPREENLFMAVGPTVEFGLTQPPAKQFAAGTAWQAQDPAHRWIFSLGAAMGDCVDRARAHEVGQSNRREWWMFRADAVVPGCTPKASTSNDTDDSEN